MIDAKQPLIYFANNSDFEAQYDNTAANDYRNKQAVFVGDTHMIYTHGVAFNGNYTTYDDSELRGLISDAEYDDTEIRGLIGDHSTFLSNLDNRLDGIYNEISGNVDADIKALLKNAQWLKDNFPKDEVFPFEDWDDDLKRYMIGLGLIEEYEEDGETKTRVGWSSLQAQYNSLLATVAQLEAGDTDTEALEAQLKLYIDGEVDAAEARLDTKYALTDAEGRALEWLSSGFESSTNPYTTFANMYSAAMTDYGTAISGVSTRVETLENAGYQTEALVGTKINEAVAGMDARITSTENSISAMSEFGTRIGDLESGLSTVSTKADDNETAIANLFATNGTGTAAISTWVNNWWSGVTISADDIYLDGQTWAQYINALGILAHELHIAGDNDSIWDDGRYVIDIDDNFVRIAGGSPSNNVVNSTNINPFSGIDIANTYNKSQSESWTSSEIKNNEISLIKKTNTYPEHYHWDKIILSPENGIVVKSYNNSSSDQTEQDVVQSFMNEGAISSNEFIANERIRIPSNSGLGNDVYIDKDGITIDSIKTQTITSSTVDTPINVTDALSFSGNTVVSDTGIVTPTLNVGENTINSNGISLSSKDITGARNIAAKNISLTTEYNGGDVEETSIVPGTIIIYDTESDGSIAFDSGSAYFGMAPNQNTLDAISNNASVKIDGINSVVTANDFKQSSDRNLKDIVSDTTLTVEQIAEAPAVNFTWKKDSGKEDKKQNVGTIAQYWQVVLPEVTGEAKDGSLTLQYGNAAMVSAIVTAKEVVALKEEIAELKRQIAELKAN